MAEDTKGYITYGKEHGISESKAKEYWKEASKSVAEQLGIKVDDINSDEQYKHVFGVFKAIINNSKKNESTITTKKYYIENCIINEGSTILLESINEDLMEEITDLSHDKFINSNHIVVKKKSELDYTYIYQYYPDKKNIDEKFVKGFMRILMEYPSAMFDVEDKGNVQYLKLVINDDTFIESDRSGAQNYNYAEHYLNQLLVSTDEEDMAVAKNNEDFSSMRTMDVGRAKTYFDKYRFDGYSIYDFIEKGKVESIVIDSNGNNMAKYNRDYYNRLGANEQEKYIANLNKIKVICSIKNIGGGLYDIPSYGAQYLMIMYPDLTVENK
jgi:hypothetical protein